jgi:LysM repeat protein
MPPKEYIVKAGDYCSTIALIYKVSIQSIADLNQLPPDCGTLYENQKLLIPIPTPMPTAMPTATLSAAEATLEACGNIPYRVAEGDSLSSISMNYKISIDSIKRYNNLTSDNVIVGMNLSLPKCEQAAPPGPTPTATLPPPYPPASLLLPPDGIVYTNLNDSIVLQWSSVGTFRENETYAITVVDVTSGEEKKIVQYTSDTKFIVPASMRPTDNTSHIFRWWVVAVRQSGTTSDGQPIYSVFGQLSPMRVFGWSGASGSALPTP